MANVGACRSIAAMKQFIHNQIITAAAIALLASTAAFAEGSTGYSQCDLYRANELSLDMFGTASIGKYTIHHLSGERIRENTRLGAGLGANYFFTRNLGIGADVYSENLTGAFIDSVSANVIFRLPLGNSGFSPYGFGGGGRQFDPAEVWFAQFGTGIEYRFTANIGAFLDGRMVFPNETKYFGVLRLGLRFPF
jgi:hypothetical protein